MLKINAESMKKFNKIFAVVFPAFLFLTLSFGRAFAIINIKGIFITEIVLFMGIFFILFNRRDMVKIPRNFLIFISIYFLFGSAYFLKGMLEENIYALRDVVFFAYTLFVPLVFLFFKDKQSLKKFLLILLASNIIQLVFSRTHVLVAHPRWTSLQVFSKIKAFNYLLYFGIALSFLIPLFYFVKGRKHRILITVLCVLNIYISILWAERSGWVALFMLFVFMALFFRARFMKFSLYFLVIFLIISSAFLVFVDSSKKGPFLSKATSLSFFFKKIMTSAVKEKAPVVKEEAAAVKEISTQSKPSIESKAPSSDELLASATEEFPEEHESLFYFSNLLFRLEMWKLAMQVGMESPVAGKGFGVLLIPTKPWKTSAVGVQSGIITAHNHILSIFYKMGLAGLALFFFINIYAFLYALRYLKDAKSDFTKFFLLGCLGSLIYWNALALLFDVIESPPTSIFLWIIIGLIFACVRVDYEKVQ